MIVIGLFWPFRDRDCQNFHFCDLDGIFLVIVIKTKIDSRDRDSGPLEFVIVKKDIR